MEVTNLSIDEIKVKFQQLQEATQKLKEEKVGYEAQLSTLQSQYDEQLKTLLEETGTTSLEEAVALCKSKQGELETLKAELQEKLDTYLGTVNPIVSENNSLEEFLNG